MTIKHLLDSHYSEYEMHLANVYLLQYIVTGWMIGGWNFSLHHRVQTGSGAHPASYPVSTRGSFPGGKWLGSEVNSPPSCAEVNNAWSYTSFPQYAFMTWYSVKAQGQIYLYS
jgi:disulfide bond formation protein DsbB